MARPSEIVHEAPAVAKIVLALVLFVLGLAAVASHHRPPPPAPCPPRACTFHPHAPHGPGRPGMTP